MKNELNQHKRSDKIKWIITCVAFVLVFVLLAGVIMQVFGKGKVKPSEWGKKSETDQTQLAENEKNGDIIVNESSNNNVQLLSAKISTDDYASYGIPAQAEDAKTITAIAKPAGADLGNLTWTLTGASSEYLTMTEVDNSTVVITCLQPYSTQTTLSVVSDIGLSASVNVHYVSKLKSEKLDWRGFGGDEHEKTMDCPNVIGSKENRLSVFYFQYYLQLTDFTTVDGPNAFYSGLMQSKMYFKCSPEFATALNEKGISCVSTYANTPVLLSSKDSTPGRILAQTSYSYCGLFLKLFCPDIYDESSHTYLDNLVGFIEAAKAVDGHHLEFYFVCEKYGSSDINGQVFYTSEPYKVTFNSSSLVIPQATDMVLDDVYF